MNQAVEHDALPLLECRNAVIDRIFQLRRVETATGEAIPLDVYIPPEEGQFLYSMVRALRPQVTIEIGMANGLSSLFIAQALRDNGVGRHIAIDPFQDSDWKGAGMQALRAAGLASLVELIKKPSHQALPELEQAGVVSQFIFIDGNHMHDYVMTDFLCADRILARDGLLAFDDSDWPAITQVLRYVLANRNYVVAYPDVVIEPPRFGPSRLGKVVRRLAQRLPKLGNKLRPDFVRPHAELGLQGRCVALRKKGPDDRNNQSTYHRDS